MEVWRKFRHTSAILPLDCCGRDLAEVWRKSGGSLAEVSPYFRQTSVRLPCWRKSGGILVEVWWTLGGSLAEVSPYFRHTSTRLLWQKSKSGVWRKSGGSQAEVWRKFRHTSTKLPPLFRGGRLSAVWRKSGRSLAEALPYFCQQVRSRRGSKSAPRRGPRRSQEGQHADMTSTKLPKL